VARGPDEQIALLYGSRVLPARSALIAVNSPAAPRTGQDARAGYRGSVTATSEAQPGTRGGGIVPAQTLTRRPKGKGSAKVSLTDRIVSTAARWIYEGRRLDMQGLADELGVSRVTLFRRVGSREELISQALWRLTERMLELAVARWEAERPEGELHTPGTIRHINAMVAGSAGLRRLLDDEPALTMRVLTDPRGRVQSGIVALNEELLRRDMAEFGLVTIIEPSALAYALVRLGESFLYADVLAARKPDVATANRLQQAIIEGILP
jgi:AcrR family transcriptional regulator